MGNSQCQSSKVSLHLFIMLNIVLCLHNMNDNDCYNNLIFTLTLSIRLVLKKSTENDLIMSIIFSNIGAIFS